MEKRRPYVPPGLVIAAVLCLLIGLVMQPVFRGLPEEVLIKNTILNGIPFILIFVAIILFYMIVIWLTGSMLNKRIRPKLWKNIETAMIGGIVLGVFLMFQPWVFVGFKIGFHLLLAATLGFIFWSHIIPAAQRSQESSEGSPG